MNKKKVRKQRNWRNTVVGVLVLLVIYVHYVPPLLGIGDKQRAQYIVTRAREVSIEDLGHQIPWQALLPWHYGQLVAAILLPRPPKAQIASEIVIKMSSEPQNGGQQGKSKR